MNRPLLTHTAILEALRQALEPLDHVYAMWEGGAAAFGRRDAWSDIDLMVDAADDHAEAVMEVIERTLAALSPIALRLVLPQPTWHGHLQTFFRLRDTTEFLVLDCLVLRHSNPRKFIEPEVHGQAEVHFDKAGVVQAPPPEAAHWAKVLGERREALGVTFALFQSLVRKELPRGNHIEALAFYHSYTLRPLVEALRLQHCPYRYNFHTRYVYYDLPAEVVRRLEALFFVAAPDELAAKQREAEAWFYSLIPSPLPPEAAG